MRTISKFPFVVIAASLLALVISACSGAGGGVVPGGVRLSDDFEAPQVIARIDSTLINESSGLTASKCREGVLWTHNDSGGGPYIYAVDLKGGLLGIWKVKGANDRDWEDIASTKEGGRCFLYIGDIGDNGEKHGHVKVYRVEEPIVGDSGTVNRKKDAELTAEAREIRFRYSGGSRNAETLLVHPETRDIYVVTKKRGDSAEVYLLQGEHWGQESGARRALVADKVGDVRVPAILGGFITGGEISPDGRRIALCDYINAFEYIVPVDGRALHDAFKSSPSVIDTGPREQGEAIAYSLDGKALLLTSEDSPSPLIKVKRKE
ncbi:MAG: hypothetical protein DWQ47_12220 [Acidobacteria bacterium]|nr:MAG: hypothetical protein DWQ32_14635 [Acidobacteriota bacterium]REJ98334.1 MAG: hypothetical protein DWQ38_17435 [Acidobacteriota bacterium]REK17078.1 MAG: hypothetical protein DWQ43_02480 [Acidobacteriota bacterium]REK42988.1 MAG: hypothetical protein DWQ47_12220 [Acidobacteriota bacterium]